MKELSLLLMKSGGHPRRIEVLLDALHKIQFKIDDINDQYVARKISQELSDNNLEKSQMDQRFRFNSTAFDAQKTFGDKEILQNMVQPFKFEQLQNLEVATNLLEFGFGSYVPSLDSTEGFLFIPYPVISNYNDISLFASMTDYFEQEEKETRGKNLEKCICTALNFYARYHGDFLKLKNICRLTGGHEFFNWKLDPITSIPNTLIDYCPSFCDGAKFSCIDFDTLANLSPGFYHPTNNFNNTADVIGILNVNDNKTNVKRLILFIQMKDWFKDTVLEKVDGGGTRVKNIVDEWRWSQQFVTKDNVFLTRTSKETSENAFANYWKNHPEDKPVFLIFSSNKIESITREGKFKKVGFLSTTQNQEETLSENEGIMDLEHCKTWFPTLGYNMQAAHKLSQLWDMPKEN